MRWIATDNIYAATWRELFEYTNNELSIKNLIKRHGEPKSARDEANYRKQASQARVCVLQAKEYMDAAQASSIFTSPNHLYYSVAALASLVMLILGDGTKSLDYLRRDRNNWSHGLKFSTNSSHADADQNINLLQRSAVQVMEGGHFVNWYGILPTTEQIYAIVETNFGNLIRRRPMPIGHNALAPLDAIKNKRWTILDLLKWFPDLDTDLRKCGVEIARSRSTLKVVENHTNSKWSFNWIFHGCENAQDLEQLLSGFLIPPRLIDSIDFRGTPVGSGGMVTVDVIPDQSMNFHWPEGRETMDHFTVSYAGHVETLEIVDLYLVAYQLSMLSRYFPDIWVRCIESQCLSAKLISRATEIIGRKFPILCLSILNNEKTVISTFRQPETI